VAAVVIVAQKQRILGEAELLGLVHVADAVELLSEVALANLVLLVLLEAALEVEVEFVVGLVGADVLVLLHVEGDGQDARQTEVGILNVLAVHLLVHVQQVGILELLNWLVRYLADPVVHAQASVLQDHLLQVVEFVSTVVISFEGFKELFDVFSCVHNFVGLVQVERLHHNLGSGPLLYNQEGQQVLVIDFTD
jgi:hypothetical protein